MSTLSALRTKFRAEVKIDPNGKIWSNDTVDVYLNRAYLKVQADGNFGWRENGNGTKAYPLVQGTAEYTLPTDFGQSEFVMLGTTELYKDDFKSVKLRNPNSVQGTPSTYYYRGTSIGFDPVPITSATATQYYRTRLPKMTSLVDCAFPEEFDAAIAKYAAYLAWSDPRGNAQTAQEKLAGYKEEMGTLKMSFLFFDRGDLTYRIQRDNPRYNLSSKAAF